MKVRLRPIVKELILEVDSYLSYNQTMKPFDPEREPNPGDPRQAENGLYTWANNNPLIHMTGYMTGMGEFVGRFDPSDDSAREQTQVFLTNLADMPNDWSPSARLEIWRQALACDWVHSYGNSSDLAQAISRQKDKPEIGDELVELTYQTLAAKIDEFTTHMPFTFGYPLIGVDDYSRAVGVRALKRLQLQNNRPALFVYNSMLSLAATLQLLQDLDLAI